MNITISRKRAPSRTVGKHGLRQGDTCLRRTLLLHGWLRWRGLRPVILFGVSPQTGYGFAAHAWVELNGVRLLPGDEEYLAFRIATP